MLALLSETQLELELACPSTLKTGSLVSTGQGTTLQQLNESVNFRTGQEGDQVFGSLLCKEVDDKVRNTNRIEPDKQTEDQRKIT